MLVTTINDAPTKSDISGNSGSKTALAIAYATIKVRPTPTPKAETLRTVIRIWCQLTSAFCRAAPSAERRGIGVGQQRAVRRHRCTEFVFQHIVWLRSLDILHLPA